MRRNLQASIFWGAVAVALVLGLSSSSPAANTLAAKANLLSAGLHFDFLTWTANAAWLKFQQAAMGVPAYLGSAERKQAVLEYLRVTHDVEQNQGNLDRMFADPAIVDKEAATADLRKALTLQQRRQRQLAPIAESVLQAQVTEILSEEGLTARGQPLPSVLYHTSATPNLLVVSPRAKIGTAYSAPLIADMNVDQMQDVESQVDRKLDVASLVVATGGIGAYPTMIMRTSDLRWLTQVIAHEWTHNYLYWHPLGFLYDKSAELRTMNETTANIVGKEVGERVIRKFYPEQLPARSAPKQGAQVQGQTAPPPALPPPFDFRREMHETRMTVDEMLAAGKVDEAEAYMERRRELFWENGYAIRKLNQAYFAFNGSYADLPGGAAGEDPVGPAVRGLRERSQSLAEFVNRMSGLRSFADLQKVLNP
jgi:hypothetical protein